MAPFYRQFIPFAEIGVAFCHQEHRACWSGLVSGMKLLTYRVPFLFQFLDVVHKKSRSDDRPDA